jgi:uracil-DNA glycosylase family 4
VSGRHWDGNVDVERRRSADRGTRIRRQRNDHSEGEFQGHDSRTELHAIDNAGTGPNVTPPATRKSAALTGFFAAMPFKSLDALTKRVVSCTRCPELRAYCADVAAHKKRAYRDCVYWGRPVPAFGDPNGRLMLVGLAPGAHGSNRTGRMFTGDASGNFLYPALHRAGFANQPTAVDMADGLELRDCIITAALRCAPPHNKPTPEELRRCYPYLLEEFRLLKNVRVMVGLGAIGTRAALDVLRDSGFVAGEPRFRFGHAAELDTRKGERTVTLVASFHPSRQNTNTGKLTAAMFDAIFVRANAILGASAK